MFRCYIIIVILLSVHFSYGQDPLKIFEDSAQYYAKKGDHLKSVGYWNKYLAVAPGAEHALFQKSVSLMHAHHFKEALEAQNLLMDITPRPPAVFFFNRAGVFLNLHRFDSAIIDLSRMLHMTNTYDSAGYRMRAEAYIGTNDLRHAKADLDSAENFAPGDTKLLALRAGILLDLQDFNGALNDVKIVLKSYPNEYAVLRMRAYAFLGLHELDKCIRACTEYLLKKPGDVVIIFVRGQAYMQKKEFNSAIEDFNSCSKTNVIPTGLYRFRAMANYYLARDEEALRDLAKAMKTDPQDGFLYYIQGNCKNNLKPGTGCDDLRKAIKLGSSDAKRILAGECG